MWTWKEQNVVGSNFHFYLMVKIKKPLQKLLDWLSYDKHREFSSINKATNEYEPAINVAVCRFFLLNNCVNSSKRLFGVTIKRRGTFFSSMILISISFAYLYIEHFITLTFVNCTHLDIVSSNKYMSDMYTLTHHWWNAIRMYEPERNMEKQKYAQSNRMVI